MTETKLCPLKQTGKDALLMAKRRKMEYCRCDGPNCALWDAERNFCGVVTIR